jgi:hypothetical protein
VIDVNWLMLSLVPSGAGYVLFTYGRKMSRIPQLLAGLALMIYPYFTGSIVALLAIGVLIVAALYAAIAFGF